MAGNSRHPGAGNRNKGDTTDSGGQIRRLLRDKGPTPKTEDRVYHKTCKAKQEALKCQANHPKAKAGSTPIGVNWVVGRNLVLEALTAGLPLRQACVAEGTGRDDRLHDIPKFAAEHSLPPLQVTRIGLGRVAGGLVRRGVALRLPAFDYTDIEDIFGAAFEIPSRGLVVALDQVTDSRNLGAIIRSAAAFGVQGVVIPARRSASMTAVTRETSAGTTTRIPVTRVTNLNQMLHRTFGAGFTVVGLAGEGDTPSPGIPGLNGPIVVVVGSEDEDLARLIRENCDALVSIPITSTVGSLNASVAASITLYEVSQQRVS